MTTNNRRIVWGICLAATVAVSAAGLLNVAQASTTPRPEASPTLRVAALGDSYASGVGAGNYVEGTSGVCWRSNNAASSLVVTRLRSAGRQVEFTNVTCSGASIADLRQPFRGESAQLDSLSARTDLVFLTVGANDIAFSAYGGLCVQGECAGAPTEAVLQRLPKLTSDLTALLLDIKTRSPRARIVLIGYGQQLSPDVNATGATLDPICGAGVVSSQERIDGNRVSRQLDDASRDAGGAARTRGVPVRFVSPFTSRGVRPAFEGHSLCQAGAPFYRGLEALAPGQEGQEAILHLNAAGHAAIATLVEQTL
jgi:lysophospholipase L1-like esterase